MADCWAVAMEAKNRKQAIMVEKNFIELNFGLSGFRRV
jgi:hypothetical protein